MKRAAASLTGAIVATAIVCGAAGYRLGQRGVESSSARSIAGRGDDVTAGGAGIFEPMPTARSMRSEEALTGSMPANADGSARRDVRDTDLATALERARAPGAAAAREAIPDILGAWSQQNLAAAVDAAFVLEPAALRHAAAREILRRNEDLESAERHAIAQRLAEPESVDWLLLDGKTAVTAADATPALDEALRMIGQSRRHARLSAIAQRLAAHAPAAAMQLALSIPDPRDRFTFERGIAHAWAEIDPIAAAGWAATQTIIERSHVTPWIATHYARSDPRAALEWARAMDREGRAGALLAVITTIAETDPVTAVETALAVEDGQMRHNVLATALAFLAARDPTLATAYLDRLPEGMERSSATSYVAIAMARHSEPARALEWLTARKDTQALAQASRQIAISWVATEPEVAIRHAQRLPEAARATWDQAVLAALTEIDPEQAVDLLMTRRGEPGFERMLVSAAHSMAFSRPELVIELADAITADAHRDAFLTAAILGLAHRAPEKTVQLLAEISDVHERAGAVHNIAQAWGQRDPATALQWVRSLPAGIARDRGYAAVVPALGSLREIESGLDRIQDQRLRDQAVFNVAMSLAHRGQVDDARTLVFRYPLEPRMMQALESALEHGAVARW